ncbi:LytR/AlgR family response regulator transcription factor [Lacihabitans soyangensis]|uniref:LytR/AlgR family response regulator transcription factor n=1 Tax=Lacihabitans soyangensis TaxID=869394 RepID=UPI0020CDD9A7|nr:LytTR family DNA-binding domain-containing protein [Lacihabitans soyangensis]
MAIKKCLVLDDEQHAVDILTDYISKTPSLSLLKALKNPIEAISLIQSETIDIAFIDVQMPNLNGLQFLKLLKKSTKVVLCTAYSEYAIDGFELNVVDYLLKPISFERFLRSVQKIEETGLQSGISRTTNIGDEYIFVKADVKGKYIKVSLEDIRFIEGLGNYQKIQLADSQIVCQLKMKNLEEQLGSFGFLRVHKSFLVPFHRISQIEGNKIHIDGFRIPIGDMFKEDVLSKLNEKILS